MREKQSGVWFGSEMSLRIVLTRLAVHLALGLGLDSILDRLGEYGIPVGSAKPPATVLRASGMSPGQVATRYQGLLNQGYLTPPLNQSGLWLTTLDVNYPDGLSNHLRLMMARAAVQVDHMMRVGAKIGTGRPFGRRYSELFGIKSTGTTDDGRDAWFVGADGRRLGVAWVGFDDNRKSGISWFSRSLTCDCRCDTVCATERSRQDFT